MLTPDEGASADRHHRLIGDQMPTAPASGTFSAGHSPDVAALLAPSDERDLHLRRSCKPGATDTPPGWSAAPVTAGAAAASSPRRTTP